MKSANEALEAERRDGRLAERDIENVRGGEREGGYIEMDLGLGVLEEKTGGRARGGEDEDEEEEEEREGGKEAGGRRGAGGVLGDLMGRKRARGKGKGKVGIEEVGI